MSMQIQCTFVVNWQDKRLVWEPNDYGNMTKLSISDYKIQRFWLPQLQVKAM